MGKNSKNRRTGKGPAAKSGPGSQASGSVSLSAFRAGRALDALTPAFVQWFDDGSPGAATAALEYLKQVETVLGRYLDGTPAAEVTGFEPVALAIAISEEFAATADAPAAGVADVENAVFAVDAVHAYVEFLSETGRWSGSPEQLAGVVDFFETIAEDDDGPGYLEVPDIPEAEALKVFSGLPLIRRATALLRWIGDGKPVTGTGALRLRDIEAAAACVGVTVRGGTKRADSALPGTAGPADSVPTVRSMYEVPLLAQMWSALEAAELIEIRSTKVVPFEDCEGFLTGGPSEQLDEFSMFTSCFLTEAVLRHDPAQPWERIIAGLQASILMAAATPEPPLLERVLAAADHAPDAEKRMADALTRVAVGRLEALAELGLLAIDTHFRVPPALIRCVADTFDHDWVMAELGLGEAPDEADVEPGAAEATAFAAEPAEPAEPAPAAPQQGAQPVLQLKIMLKGSRPPIWRRVLVPAGMPLPQLHAVIQALFGWLDYHLHQFQTGGFRGPTYAPVGPDAEDAFYGEPSRDESKATVGQLLPAVGTTMTYTYDFGDDWEHAITVEKILVDDDGVGQLPRCTAGRGAAPAEDSGGTWGWANIVQAVNDPRHEEHQEYREWLGLRPGETLDPKAFDVEEVNEDLADLF
ncbi:plasmid pRiA4b ORF-3 family protein [Arthrobacter sp. PAMC25564]|uniref:plasmid pRiA4b ORF-3 family protein n=1 Tax=Arthrobacter sp. PAMC25564 TaxID=2565366 RepID=UPI0014486A06|nr:plasmid pRiA4b ORF-3 family protein [Arthrobacter sp. PAMC25564]